MDKLAFFLIFFFFFFAIEINELLIYSFENFPEPKNKPQADPPACGIYISVRSNLAIHLSDTPFTIR